MFLHGHQLVTSASWVLASFWIEEIGRRRIFKHNTVSVVPVFISLWVSHCDSPKDSSDFSSFNHSLVLGLQPHSESPQVFMGCGSHLALNRLGIAYVNISHSSSDTFLIHVHYPDLTASIGHLFLSSYVLHWAQMDGHPWCGGGDCYQTDKMLSFPYLCCPHPHMPSFLLCQESSCKFSSASPPDIHSQESLNLNGNIVLGSPLPMRS